VLLPEDYQGERGAEKRRRDGAKEEKLTAVVSSKGPENCRLVLKGQLLETTVMKNEWEV
jgi:hypothetical protein